MFHFIAYFHLATLVQSLLLGFLVIMKNPRNILNRTFMVYSFFMTAATFIQFQLVTAADLQLFLFWKKFDFFIFIAVLVQLFLIIQIPKKMEAKTLKRLIFLFTILSLLIVIIHVSLAVPNHAGKESWGYYSIYHGSSNLWSQILAYTASLVAISSLVLSGIYFFKSKERYVRFRLGLLFLGFMILILGGIFVDVVMANILELQSPFSSSNFFFLVNFFFAWVIWRFHVFDLNLVDFTSDILHMMSDSLVLVNRHGTIVTYNEKLSESLRVSKDQIIGNDINGLFSNLRDFSDTSRISHIINNHEAFNDFECHFTGQGGHKRFLSISGTALFKDRTEYFGYLLVIRDISNRKRDEQMIRQSKNDLEIKNQELQELVATKDKLIDIIAHDLRNPLQALHGTVGFMLKFDDLTPEKRRKSLKLMQVSVERGNHLIANILEWSHIRAGNIKFVLQTFLLYPLVDECINLLSLQADNKEVELMNELDTKTRVSADRNMLSVILRNILSNCIKFSYKKGLVTINAHQNDTELAITVKDQGVGMSQETIDKILQYKHTISSPGTSREKGSGLGLAICQEFIEEHGGRLEIKNNPDAGASFIIYLPIKDK